MENLLILGAGGFIGKAVVEKLSEQYPIRAFDRKIVDEFVKYNNVEMVVGNFADSKKFDQYLNGIDTVIHLISTTVPSDETANIPDEIEENVISTINLLESMVRCKVKNIVFASSAGTVYGETGDRVNTVKSPLNPKCSYGVQKCVIEKYLEFYARRYDINVKIMRITNPYGWGQDKNKAQGLIPIFINKFLTGEPITIFGDGSHKRDYLFITDLANAFLKVLEYQGDEHLFNIGYGEYYSINDIVHLIEDKMDGSFADIKYVKNRFCDVHSSYIDVNKTQKIINWHPTISVELGIEKTINALNV